MRLISFRISLVFTFAALVLAVLRQNFPSSLIFDQGLIVMALVFFVYFMLKKTHISLISKISYLHVAAGLSIFYIFTTSVLMNIDRSRSFYVLKWIQECKQSPCYWENSKAFGNQGVKDLKLRINEQTVRGLLENNSNGSLRLSSSGKAIYLIANGMSVLFNLEEYKKQ